MVHKHRLFIIDMLAKIGTPVFAGTFVACLLKDEFQVSHGILMAAGVALMYLAHRLEFHGAE